MFRKIKKALNRISEKLRALNIVKGRFVKAETSKDNFLSKFLYNHHRPTLYVGKNGEEFSTIQDAVNNAMDTAKFTVTIIVMPGTYIESVVLRGGRYISIIGTDKNTCILRNDTGNYFTPPLEMAGNSSIRNMTIIATHDEGLSYDFSSYAVHHDFAGEGTSVISDCILKSYQNSAIGIGLHKNQTLIIDNCEMYSDTYSGIYVHNRQKNDANNQRFILKNSRVESRTGAAIIMRDANHRIGGGFGDAKDTEFSFYNNIFWSRELGETGVTIGSDAPLLNGCLAGYIKLTPDSYGNNISELNAS
jgi:hypothetical protein